MGTKQSNNSVATTDAVKIANQRALFNLEWENDTVFKKRELNYKTKAAFQKDLEAGKISKYTTVFIKDSKEIYKNGQYYGNSDGGGVSGLDEISLSQDIINGSTNSGNFTEKEYNKILAASEKGFIIVVNPDGTKFLSKVLKNTLSEGKIQLNLFIGEVLQYVGNILLTNNIIIKDKSENYAFTSNKLITNIYNGSDGHIAINTSPGTEESTEIDLIVNGSGTKFLSDDGQYKTIEGGSAQSSNFVIFDYNKEFLDTSANEERSSKMMSAIGKPCILIYNKKQTDADPDYTILDNSILYGIANNDDQDLVVIDFYGLCNTTTGVYINKNVRISQDITTHEINSIYDGYNSDIVKDSNIGACVKFSSNFDTALADIMLNRDITVETYNAVLSEYVNKFGSLNPGIVNIDVSDILRNTSKIVSASITESEGYKELFILSKNGFVKVAFDESDTLDSIPLVSRISFDDYVEPHSKMPLLCIYTEEGEEWYSSKKKYLLVDPVNYLDLELLTNSFSSSDTITLPNDKDNKIDVIQYMYDSGNRIFISDVWSNGDVYPAIVKLSKLEDHKYKMIFNVLSNDSGYFIDSFTINVQHGYSKSTYTIERRNVVYIKDNGDGTQALTDNGTYKLFVPEAPTDGGVYGRKNKQWEKIESIKQKIVTESEYSALGDTVNTDGIIYFVTPDA